MSKKGNFVKGGSCECALFPVFVPGEHANIPSFWFSFRGNIRAYPRSGFLRRPLKTTFDMTTLIFSTGVCPSYPFYSFKRAPWYPVFRENPSREVATKDHSSSNPAKGNPPDLKTKVDVSKVDVKGFPNFRSGGKHPPQPPFWKSTPLATPKIANFIVGLRLGRCHLNIRAFCQCFNSAKTWCIAKKGLFISCTQGGL